MRVVLFTPSSFRTVNAGALRNVTLASALVLEGHTVRVAYADSTDCTIAVAWAGLVPEGVELVANGASRRGLSRALRILGGAVRGDLHRFEDADVVILYNPDPVAFRRAQKWTRHRSIGLVVDLSEWLSTADLPLGLAYGPWYQRFMRTLPSRVQYGLAISTPMRAHLASRGAMVALVPPVHFPVPEGVVGLPAVLGSSPPTDDRSGRASILVSGAGLTRKGKDLASIMWLVEAIRVDPKLGEVLEFHVAGHLDPTALAAVEQLRHHATVTVHGWLDYERSLALLRSVDWLLQWRDASNRRATYGFPSKVTEALVNGTPVLTNDFGDVPLWVRSGRDGLVVEKPDPNAVRDALCRATTMRLDRATIAAEAGSRLTPAACAQAVSEVIEAAREASLENP